jgi:hypothetical protein
LGIDRKTIAKCLAPAIAESLAPGGEQITETPRSYSQRNRRSLLFWVEPIFATIPEFIHRLNLHVPYKVY